MTSPGAETSGASTGGAKEPASSASSAPRVVAVGGGHGLAATLRAVRTYTHRVTAVVSVADDGGSTGRIRAAADRPAPGDLRKCLIALSDSDSVLSRSMDHRFTDGDLAGHAMGNLLIVAMTETEGDLVAALDEIGRLTAGIGRVLPATTDVVELTASVGSGRVVAGQVAVGACSDVSTVSLNPNDATACPDAVTAIEQADQIVLGPGSLYTSVLAATAVDGIRHAIIGASAQLVYVCNLHPQTGETSGYDVASHVRALGRHQLIPDVVLHDPGAIGTAEGVAGAHPAAVARSSGLAHDPALLGAALSGLLTR